MSSYTEEEAVQDICANSIDEAYMEAIIKSEGVAGTCDDCKEDKVVLTLSI